MIRSKWREVAFWRWWWRFRAPRGLKLSLALGVTVAVLGGGFFAADRLSSAHAGVGGANAVLLETTVDRLVTVRERGRVVVRHVPVVRRVLLRPQTQYETRYGTVTAPGATRYVQRLVPVVRQHVVTVGGRTSTVTQTRLVPTTRIRTRTSVVTNQQTIQQTVQQTVDHVVTVVQNHVDTVVQPVTETLERTVTQPVTVTDTQTETQTVEVTVTETVTNPPSP